MEISIRSKSSCGQGYLVHFMLREGVIRLDCDCQAGIMGQLCKHRVAFAKLESSMLHNEGDIETLRGIGSWEGYALLLERVTAYEREIDEIARAKADLAKREKGAKYALVRHFTGASR